MGCGRSFSVLLAFVAVLGPGSRAWAESGWTGFYAGGTVGRRFTDSDWQTTCLGFQCPATSGIYTPLLNTENPYLFEDTSTRYGAYAGAQFQLQNIVLGFEGDYARAHNQSSSSGIPGAETAGLGDGGPDSAEVRAHWDASIRARAGLLLTPQLMVFLTGGKAWLKQEMSVSCNIEFDLGWCSLANVGKTERNSGVLEGWTWGTGIEALLDGHWMLRLEFRHSEFEEMKSVYFENVLGGADRLHASTNTESDTVSIGIAYKF
jgi:outer membrane immunogenic protein